jgi:hypothetical protein
VPQRRQGIHICGTASRDIAGQHGVAHQHDADGGTGGGIGGLHVRERELTAPISKGQLHLGVRDSFETFHCPVVSK